MDKMKANTLAIITGAIGFLVWVIAPLEFFPYSLIIGSIGSFLLGYFITDKLVEDKE